MTLPRSGWAQALAICAVAALIFVAALAAAPGSAGENQDEADASATDTSLPEAPSLARPLKKGMSRVAVLHEWGPPHRTEAVPTASDAPTTEVWYYKTITLVPAATASAEPSYLRTEAQLTFVDNRLTQLTATRTVLPPAR